jgi:RNA polymerase sigma-70 factor (ECF subfamily)
MDPATPADVKGGAKKKTVRRRRAGRYRPARVARMVNETASEQLDGRVRALIAAGSIAEAATMVLRAQGPEVWGFLAGVLRSDVDADEVFAATSERFWRSLARFEWRCSLRTWLYVLARNELDRFHRGARRHVRGRTRISELADVLAAVKTDTRSRGQESERRALDRLRDELPPEDRALLVLRVDRELSWDEVALAFVGDPERCSDEERTREAARLRKRFQLVKTRIAARARETGLLGGGRS